MRIRRSSIRTGPAIVYTQGVAIYFKTGLKIDEVLETFDVTADAFGTVDKRVQKISAKISGTPAGEWRDLFVLFPWLATPIGTRLFGSEDTPLIIHALDGTRYTYHNTALTKMPGLKFAATETLLGDVEWTALVRDNTDPREENAIFSRDTAPFGDASFETAAIKTQPYTLVWGEGEWIDFPTVDGITLDWSLSTDPVPVDGFGDVDFIFKNLEASLRFRPLVSQAAIDAKLALQDSPFAAQGASLAARGETLKIIGTDVHCEIYGVAATGGSQEFAMSAIRNGELTAIATRDFSQGVRPLAYIGTQAP